MKKTMVFLCALVLVLGMIGTAGATYVVDPLLGGSWGTTFVADLDGDGVYDGDTADDWSITAPGAFTITVGIDDCCIVGDYFDIFVDGALIGTTPVTAPYGSTLSSASFDVTLSGGAHIIDFQDVALRDFFPGTYGEEFSPAGATVTISGITAVPEPATLFLFGTAVLGLAGVTRKKIKK